MFYILNKSVRKTVVAMFVSATLAAPAPLWAENSSGRYDVGGEATDGIPVILQPIKLKGKQGYLAITAYRDEDEAGIIQHFAKNDPGHLILGVSGPDDKALQFALHTGNLASISTYFVADAENANAVKAAPLSIRAKIKEKINRLSDICKRKKVGLITAVVVSGIVSGYVGVTSASVPIGFAAFTALFTWAGYQAVMTDRWEGYLEKGGNMVKKLVRWGVGREPTEDTKRTAEAFGMFGATLVANMGVQGAVLGASGTFNGIISSQGVLLGVGNIGLSSLWYGFLSSTDILDALVLRKIREGKLPATIMGQDTFGIFVVMRMIAAACFEVAGYLNIPGVQWVLAGTASFTLVYLAFKSVNVTVDSTYDKSKAKAQLTYRYYRRNTYRVQLKNGGGCEGILNRKDITIARGSLRGEPAE